MSSATTLRNVFRTTAFRISAIYLVIFFLFAFFLIGYLAISSTRLLTERLIEDALDETGALVQYYNRSGIRRFALAIERRGRSPGAGIYLLTDRTGRSIAGNILEIPSFVFKRDPDQYRPPVPYTPIPTNITEFQRFEAEQRAALVVVRELPGGFRLIVGRDMGEMQRLPGIVLRAAGYSIILLIALGVISWLFITRRVLRRIDAVGATGQQIMEGDFSKRLPLTGSGDEFDRLSESLNAMLARIEALVTGLKNVSDNIAHDLKTPISRMRNRVDMALRTDGDGDDRRAVLEATIEDCDNLIRIFDALLRIARVEAGSAAEELETIDFTNVVSDIAELYEPVAEDSGVDFQVEIADGVSVGGNRELLGQAIVNLVDNAFKYCSERPGGEERKPLVSIRLSEENDHAVLRVCDNGPGIPDEQRARVFERFVRLEESRTKPGSGLGLSLVRAVAHYLSGTITLEDNRPGLCAVFSLPVAGGEKKG